MYKYQFSCCFVHYTKYNLLKRVICQSFTFSLSNRKEKERKPPLIIKLVLLCTRNCMAKNGKSKHWFLWHLVPTIDICCMDVRKHPGIVATIDICCMDVRKHPGNVLCQFWQRDLGTMSKFRPNLFQKKSLDQNGLIKVSIWNDFFWSEFGRNLDMDPYIITYKNFILLSSLFYFI